MFIAAVMRPVFDVNGEVLFSGKIRIWPFIEVVPAKRNSCDRSAGTLETKSVTVDRPRHRAMLIDKVIPAIKALVPPEMQAMPLVIQQDGAKPHVICDDPEVAAACAKYDWTIRVESQPTQSPTSIFLAWVYLPPSRASSTKRRHGRLKSSSTQLRRRSRTWN